MLLDFKNLYVKYMSNFKGVIHIGAHLGEEIEHYRSINCKNIIFIEPQIHIFNKLKTLSPKNDENILFFNTALGNNEGIIEMYVESVNNGASSSILKPALVENYYPHIIFNEKQNVNLTKFKTLIEKNNIIIDNFNLINIDVQGYELEVFKGCENYLNNIDYIITEFNTNFLYENCCLVEDLDNYLKRFNFIRKETLDTGYNWGDAFYCKV